MKTVEYEYIETANRAGIENCILKIVREKGHETDTSFHWHHGTEINYIISGAAVYTCEGKKITVREGDFFLIGSGKIHMTENCTDGEIRAMTVVLPDSYLRSLRDEEVPCFVCDSAEGRETLRRDLEQLADCLENPKPHDDLLIRSLLTGLIYHLYSVCDKEYGSSDNELCRDIMKYSEEHMQEKLTVEEISGQFGMQKNYFCRYFRKHTGTSYHQYLSRIRTDYALSLLASGGMRSLDCAVEAGFASEKVFIEWCRKLYGCTPLQYVRQSS